MNIAVIPKSIVSAAAGTHCLRADVSAKVEVGFIAPVEQHWSGAFIYPEMTSCMLTLNGHEIDVFGEPADVTRRLRSVLQVTLEEDMRDEALEGGQ